MPVFAIAAGVVLALLVLWDSFETILLPRRASGPVRLTRFVLAGAWRLWSAASRAVNHRPRSSASSIRQPVKALHSVFPNSFSNRSQNRYVAL